jgi:hypothetical protein
MSSTLAMKIVIVTHLSCLVIVLNFFTMNWWRSWSSIHYEWRWYMIHVPNMCKLPQNHWMIWLMIITRIKINDMLKSN